VLHSETHTQSAGEHQTPSRLAKRTCPTNASRDQEWAQVLRAQAGDHEAFAELLRPHMGKVYRITLKITNSHEDAEDAAQEAYINAYKYIRTFQGGSRFSSWLIRIAINEARMKLRKRRTANYVSLDDSSMSEEHDVMPRDIAATSLPPDSLYQRKETRERLVAAIQEMRPTSRDIVFLRGLQEQSVSEAAKLLDVSISAVKTRFRRARLELREQLSGQLAAWAS
jgi:RNA polymerase sigma-70 factor, ECF subfamily